MENIVNSSLIEKIYNEIKFNNNFLTNNLNINLDINIPLKTQIDDNIYTL